MSFILDSTGYNVLTKDVVYARDTYLYDSKDKCYVDFEAGVWCTSLGHNHKRINDAIMEQLQKISHVGYRYPNFITEEAAEKLMQILEIPSGKCVFLNSGSEAVELGVQMAKSLNKKPLLLGFANTYLAAYGNAGSQDKDNWHLLDWSSCTACTEKCCKACSTINNIPFENICAFVFEPGNSSGLIKLPPKQLVKALEIKIKEHNGLIVVDEITTGTGRTGKWFGYMHYDLSPDIIAIGKGIGSGYPVSITAMKEDIAQKLEADDFHYAQSHQNDALGCAVVKEVISTIQDEDYIERSKNVGAWFKEGLKLLANKHSCIKEVRGIGLMLGLEFIDNIDKAQLAKLHNELFNRGFLVGYKPAVNLLRFYPALTIKEQDISNALSNLDDIICRIFK